MYHPIFSVFSFVYELLRYMNFLGHFTTNCSRALSRFTGTFEKFVHGHFTGSRALNSCSRALLGVHGQVCSKIFTGSCEMFTGTFLKLFTGTFKMFTCKKKNPATPNQRMKKRESGFSRRLTTILTNLGQK